ncbi:MAG: hypothetical protein WEC59_05490 [Salibacteraceae bacterium]
MATELGIGKIIYNDIYEVSCNDVKMLSEELKLPIENIISGDVDEIVSFLVANDINPNAIISFDVLEHIYDVETHFKTLGAFASNELRIVYGSGANIRNKRYVNSVAKYQINIEHNTRKKVSGHKSRDTLESYLDARKK